MAGGRRQLPRVGGRVQSFQDVDRQLRNLQDRVDELQRNPLFRGKFFAGVELANNVDVPIRHGLGRMARVLASPLYAIVGVVTPGLVRDRTRLLADQYDPSQYVVLRADTVGTTVYVDLWIY